MIDAPSGGNERAFQAERLFRQSVIHSERDEWEAALSAVEKALALEKRVAYAERRALILERLCRLDDAMLARRQATALAEQLTMSHLEEVLEFRPDGQRVLEQRRVGAPSGSYVVTSGFQGDPAMIEPPESQSDRAMLGSVHRSSELQLSIDHLIGTSGGRVRQGRRASARPKVLRGAARRRAASQAAAQHLNSPRVQKKSWLGQAWYALLRGLGFQR